MFFYNALHISITLVAFSCTMPTNEFNLNKHAHIGSLSTVCVCVSINPIVIYFFLFQQTSICSFLSSWLFGSCLALHSGKMSAIQHLTTKKQQSSLTTKYLLTVSLQHHHYHRTQNSACAWVITHAMWERYGNANVSVSHIWIMFDKMCIRNAVAR